MYEIIIKVKPVQRLDEVENWNGIVIAGCYKDVVWPCIKIVSPEDRNGKLIHQNLCYVCTSTFIYVIE